MMRVVGDEILSEELLVLIEVQAQSISVDRRLVGILLISNPLDLCVYFLGYSERC